MLAETIIIIFAELTRFNKTLEECEDDLDKLCYIFKHGGRLMDRPAILKSEKYYRIFEACEIAAFSEEKRTQYENDMMEEREFNSKIETAERKGMMRVAAAMLAKGIGIELIAECTGLTLEEVKSLQQQ